MLFCLPGILSGKEGIKRDMYVLIRVSPISGKKFLWGTGSGYCIAQVLI